MWKVEGEESTATCIRFENEKRCEVRHQRQGCCCVCRKLKMLWLVRREKDRWWAQNCIYVFFVCKSIKRICEKNKNYVFRELIA